MLLAAQIFLCAVNFRTEETPAAEFPASDGAVIFPLTESLNVTCFSFSNIGKELANILVTQNHKKGANIHFEIAHVFLLPK